MIDSTEQDLTLPVPLTLQAHYAALLFYQQHADARKAKQVYLNTLAVSAVRAYLSWLGIASDLQASDSWNPTLQALADIADLDIPGQGKLECRPVLPEATACYVAPETWSNRIGYIAVLLDADLKTATLLGFVPSVDTEELPLEQLQPVATLLDMLKPQPQPQQDKELVNLSHWAQGIFTTGWRAVEELLEPQPVVSFRSLELASNLKPSVTTRGKILELVPRSLSHQVVLLVGLIPNNSLQLDIWIKLAPTNCGSYLPEDLEIKVLDEHGVAVMQAQSRQTDMLQLQFQGVIGEQFSIELGLNDINLVETFVI
ncbi:DUF1822 family protein [Aliterella atlantica]|uniref:DUF1822 family protein n=1 Tax=Aliterella atlantica CENA595 TaxID=1618023 RepID=A0A0D8ZLU2_9CYAN|nr:DUF1822 family protein [Aliterella atlantica]KJH69367.1 hypothetical protein UH38_24275 [Aliterella atlantica CENA595]